PVELGEARLVLVHVSLTPQPPGTFTGPRRTEQVILRACEHWGRRRLLPMRPSTTKAAWERFNCLVRPLLRSGSMGAMTVVFVHGVPETPAVWHGLLAALDRPDTVALSLPGFDSARPAGFGATMEEYAGWLAAQLERLGDPVDLVGHDWGGGFVVRVVSTRPELVRSWVTDAAGIGDVEFEWHDFAKIWQTPQAWEDFWDQQLAAPAKERASVFQMFGVPEEPALDLASR